MPVGERKVGRKFELPQYLLVQLIGTDEALRRFLSRHPAEIQGASVKGSNVVLRVILPHTVLEIARGGGLRIKIELNLTEAWAQAVQNIGFGSGLDPKLLTLGLTSAASVGYLLCPAVAANTVSLAAAHADLCELIVLPHKTANPVQPTTCHAISIEKMAPADAPTILILGGIHGREWGSCEIALNFVDELIAAYKGGTDVTMGNATFTAVDIANLVETRKIVVFPMVNPDGREYSQSGLDKAWRKNRNPAEEVAGDPRSVGVDINRNFDFLFNLDDAFVEDCGVMVSTDPSDHDLYQGPFPFSEAESQNVKYLLDRFEETNWLVDLHSSSQTLMCPWSDDDTQTVDDQMSFANPLMKALRGVANTGYGEYMLPDDAAEHYRLMKVMYESILKAGGPGYSVKTGFEFGASSGTSHDYAYSRHLVDPQLSKVLGFVVEWGKSPYPDWPIMKPIVSEVTAALFAFSIDTQPAGP